MAKYFEDLEVWKMSKELWESLSKIFYAEKFRNYGFQDQIMRAIFSVSNNIAEWFERGSNKDFVKFLYYSKWSVWEVRNLLYFAKNLKYINDSDFENYKSQCLTLSTKIHNLISYLIKSDKK